MEIYFGHTVDERRLAERLTARGLGFGAAGIVSILRVLTKLGIYSYFPATFFAQELKDPAFEFVLSIMRRLRKNGVMKFMVDTVRFPDEPRIHYCVIEMSTGQRTAGSSFFSRTNAAIAALAETVERFVWFNDSDCLGVPHVSSYAALHEAAIDPMRFSGFGHEMRAREERLRVDRNTVFSWVRGHSLVQGRSILLPAHVVSEAYGAKARAERGEPNILISITTGLATATTKEEAMVKAILEIMERDALMLHYYPKITPPRLDLEELASQDEEIAEILKRFRRYRLAPHLLYFSTDIPAHAVCCVLEDESGPGPALVLGMRTSFSLKTAILDSLKEAGTMRHNLRSKKGNTYPKDYREFDMWSRGAYWGERGHTHELQFMLQGATIQKKLEPLIPWNEQLSILAEWFKAKGYECAFANLGNSKYNIAGWHIYMAVCPELQPMHLLERYATLSGERIESMLAKQGQGAKMNPIPHPFM